MKLTRVAFEALLAQNEPLSRAVLLCHVDSKLMIESADPHAIHAVEMLANRHDVRVIDSSHTELLLGSFARWRR